MAEAASANMYVITEQYAEKYCMYASLLWCS